MGSLMAGWNSPTLNRGYGRSSSFTKYEIEEFKNKLKNTEQEHRQAAALVAQERQRTLQDNMKVNGSKKPEEGEEPSVSVVSVEEELERSNSFKDWWTKSTWAFLNDPAMKRMEAAHHKYTAQFHVAASAPTSPSKSH